MEAKEIVFPDDWFEQLKSVYPSRSGGQGWGEVPRLIHKILMSGGTWPQLLAGATSYRSYCDREGMTGTGYVRMAQTFFGPGCWWQESYEAEEKPKLPAQIALERRWESLKNRAIAASFRQPTPMELQFDPSVYEQYLKWHEQAARKQA